jgi:hypothetical protein
MPSDLPARYPALGGATALLRGADHNPDQWLVNWHEACRPKRPGMHRLSSLQAVPPGATACSTLFVESGSRVLIGTVDTFMVSRVSDGGVAAPGVANQVVNLGLMLFTFIGAGSTVLMTHHLGAGDRRGADRIAVLAMSINGWLGLLVSATVIALSGAPRLAGARGAKQRHGHDRTRRRAVILGSSTCGVPSAPERCSRRGRHRHPPRPRMRWAWPSGPEPRGAPPAAARAVPGRTAWRNRRSRCWPGSRRIG